jgi:hypothetical protein
MFVQQVIKDLHSKKVLVLFIKFDISKAFDTLNWSYFLDIMAFLGFELRWRSWIGSLWSTSSSAFLLNGEPGARIRHCHGVWQGDHLSPCLFFWPWNLLTCYLTKLKKQGSSGTFTRIVLSSVCPCMLMMRRFSSTQLLKTYKKPDSSCSSLQMLQD